MCVVALPAAMNRCVDFCNKPSSDEEEPIGAKSRWSRYFDSGPTGVHPTTLEHCYRIFKIMDDRTVSLANLQHIKTYLDRSPKKEHLLEPVDEQGWNILQKSIINNHAQVVLMIIGKGVDINAGACTLPLHLACKIGRPQIVEMLLDHGARADLSRGVCYPVPHICKPAAGSAPAATSGLLATATSSKFRCIQISAQPLTHAIPNDRDEVVRVLLTHRHSRDIVKRDNILYEACNYRAKKSLKILVETMPEQVNVRDRKGLTPLQHALMGSKNRECAVILLESRAQFSPEIFETQCGTLLHQLYASDDTSHLLRLTQLILDKGPKDLIAMRSGQDNDTLLHILLKNFGGPTPRDRELYVKEVIQCIELLIVRYRDYVNLCYRRDDVTAGNRRSTVNAGNKRDETPLHALLSHSDRRPLFYNRDRFGVGPKYMLHQLEKTCMLMEVLFRHGADPNIPEHMKGATPLYYLLRILCAMSINLLNISMKEAQHCIQMLCAQRADPNCINGRGDNAMTLLFSSLSRWLYNASADPVLMEKLLTFTEDSLRMFLRHGLDPKQFLRKNLKQYAIIFNSTNLDGTFLRSLIDMLKAVILFGGNPNQIKLNDLHGGASTSFVTKYTVGYYLARGLYIHARYHNPATFEILDVFKNTLRQKVLAKFVGGICSNLETVFEHGSHNIQLQERIRSIYSQPRTLKQLCRIEIFEALHWKIEGGLCQLPLPQPLILELKCI